MTYFFITNQYLSLHFYLFNIYANLLFNEKRANFKSYDFNYYNQHLSFINGFDFKYLYYLSYTNDALNQKYCNDFEYYKVDDFLFPNLCLMRYNY